MSELLDSRFVLGSYWGVRKESIDVCARRLAVALDGLAKVTPLLDGWYRKGASKAAASREPVGRSLQQLRDLLDAGRQRKDVGGDLMAELGFSAALWNRQSDRAAAWSVTCGAYPPAGVGVSNAFVIDWPERGNNVTIEDDLALAKAAMQTVVEAWQPEWATWTSRAMRKLQQAPPRHPVLGLLTYLGPTREVPAMDPDLAVEALIDGHLLTVEPCLPDLSSRLLRLRDVLAGTEALRPTS